MKKKLVDLFLSLKFFIFAAATFSLYFGKVSETIWMETVLIVGGLRTAAQVMSQHIESKKGVTNGQPEK